MPPLALDPGTVLIAVPLLTIPIAALMFAMGAGKALKEIGKGPLAMDHDFPASGPAPVSKTIRESEIRQMLEAKAYRAGTRGEKPIDVDKELLSLLESEKGPSPASDRGLRAEVRSLVVARNARLERAGKKTLDVEMETDRRLAELEDLGS
jgi:hypothetical protein